MGKKIEWLADFKGCHECQGLKQGFRSIAESLVYTLLVFCMLGAVYACFEIEPESSFLPAAEVDGLGLKEDLG